jgi:diacylglycerol kinase (ATP)
MAGQRNSAQRSLPNREERICLILNPKAAAGAAGRKGGGLKEAIAPFFTDFEIRTTRHPGHASELAAEAAEQGFDIVAAMGGDGTCHEVLNGLIQDDKARNPSCLFTVIPVGTGSDLIKSVKIPKSIPAALRMAATGNTRSIDVGKAVVTTDRGDQTRYFINVAGFGANGEVVKRVNDGSKRLGGKLTFLNATLKTAITYKAPFTRIEWKEGEEERSWEGELLSCFIANGLYCGGGMSVAPKGSMADGRLDLTILKKMGIGEQIYEMRHLYDGEIERVRSAICSSMQQLRATSRPSTQIRIDLDGELSGRLPATFSILPGLLRVRGGWIHDEKQEDSH